MELNFAKQQAKRNGRNSIVRAILVIVAVVLVKFFAFPGGLVNTFGPYAQFSASAELEGLYGGHKRYVAAQAPVLFDAGYVLSEDNRDKWYFYAFWAGDQMVLCRVPLSYNAGEYMNYAVRGKLETFGSDYEELRTRFIGDVAEVQGVGRAEAEAQVSPYIVYLDYNRIGDQAIWVLAAAAVVLALLAIARALRGMAGVETTKSFKLMAKLPGYDPAQMNEQISRELAEGRVLFKSKQVVITENWVGETKPGGFAIYPKRDVVWVHRTVTQHRTNGIPSGKTHVVGLSTVNRNQINLAAKNERDAVRLMEELQNCGFEAVFGFTPELQGLYLGNMEQFAAIARQQRPPAPAAATRPVVAGYGAPPAAPAASDKKDSGAVNIDEYKGPEL